jgi:hypothetical protein
LDELVEIARDSPEPAAVRSVVRALSLLAADGDHGAALMLGRIVADELGLSGDAEAWQATDPESVLAAALPPLVKVFVLGYAPRFFLANLEPIRELVDEVKRTDVFIRFKEVVRRDAPVQDAVLAAFILAGFAVFHPRARAVAG